MHFLDKNATTAISPDTILAAFPEENSHIESAKQCQDAGSMFIGLKEMKAFLDIRCFLSVYALLMTRHKMTWDDLL